MSTTATSSPSASLPDLGKYSRHPHADIILRSSDSHDFRVPKFYVVDSSPVLGEQIILQIMAATCHGAGPEAISGAPCEAATMDGETVLPVVKLPESRPIISSLLTFVFPVPPVLPPTIEQILELLSVAQKYEMTTALTRIRDYASRRDSCFICPENALRVYSLARTYGLLEETLDAAEATLMFPMTIQELEDKLDIMPGFALYELWRYRQQVLENLGTSLGAEFIESELYRVLANLNCVEMGENIIPPWIDSYLHDVQNEPACVDLTNLHLALSSHVSSMGNGCKHCSSIPRDTIYEFWTALKTVVLKSIKKAESGFLLTQGEIRFQSITIATTEASPLPEGLNMQGADVILHSSDLVSFRVHKSILAISSPFFNDLFSLPQPPDDEAVEGLPIVHVSENAELLRSLLSVLYPIPSVIPDDYEKTLALLAASQKYNMETALSTVRSEIGRQLPSTEAAFRAYAIASNKQLIPEMDTAARLTLDHPMMFEVIADTLPLFEGSALHDLVHFRKRCHDNLLGFFVDFVGGDDNLSKAWCGCRKTKRPHCALRSDKGTIAGWLRNLISQHIKSLQETYTRS